MHSNIVTVRLDDKTCNEIEAYSKEKSESQSDIIRKAILQYVQKQRELNEIKSVVSRKFAEGKISFDELVRIIGFEEAKKVAYFVDVAEKSLTEGF